MSKAGQILAIIAQAANGAGVVWGTSPEAVWFVDLESEALRARGLTALVVMPEGKLDFKTRGTVSGDEFDVHIAVIAPRGNGDFAAGDVVVDAAEKVAAVFIGKLIASGGVRVTCMEASLSPVISGEFMRKNDLWVSYLKLPLKVVF
jgi:hypothetical protein